ncbi:MAG: YebC/PmpR family DNA-binding transcriptional regulator [candidate division Zixibacteria bacterium]|nr:YebC/PmpR family DNA-binding transcriptional regulator [candidate division Zixibacteria bacterium]MBU1471946.1 YebC/PmpR family DNA-binding transcriptional regulator [candidate division Zixibacteria bacterium]MBU2625255.1 YebC/PmpR family DNA-binding transcriptional regulator [candidate division Zixibacteria bacterium]
MSGHSKWATIKRKKGKLDAQRGRMFTKLIKEITVAARAGGGDQEGNPRLRTAVATAKAANMPQDNIKKAIQKGTGELPGVTYDEVSYEGYGPGGVAILLEVLTDNKNRTVAEIRHALTKRGGNLGETGCVGWMFEKKGLVQVESSAADEEKLFEIALEAGASDMSTEGDIFEITTPFESFEAVRSSIENAGIAMVNAEVTMIPQSTVELDESKANSMLKLMEELEDHDDVQKVYANFDISDELMEKLSA